MAKKIANFGKKTLSMLLALIMVMSMVQIPTFASSADQIMEGYYVVGSNNVPGEVKSSAVVTEYGYTVSKTIAPTDKVNEFDITLTVRTSQTVTLADSAIALVIDNSSSMDECAESQRTGLL